MKVEKMLPEVYYKESRDFAFIGRLIEILFNYMKSGADCVNAPLDSDTANPNIIQLLVNTLGFDSKREYINKDLVYIASTFSELLKNKGTEYAIETAIRLLLNSQDIKDYNNNEFIEVDEKNNYLSIKIPESLDDLVLLEDLFDYILPIGTLYKFIKVGDKDTVLTTGSDIATELDENSNHLLSAIQDYELTSYVSGSSEISGNIQGIENVEDNGLGTIYTGNVLHGFKPQTRMAKAPKKRTASKKVSTAKVSTTTTPAKLNVKDNKGENKNDNK